MAAKKFLKHLRIRYLFVLLVVQTIALVTYLHMTIAPFTTHWSRLHDGLWNGDEPDYLRFPLGVPWGSSLHAMLDNVRSFGLPLFFRLYTIFFHTTFVYWPHFQFVFYVLSVFFLFWALIKFGFDKILAFIVASLLLWHIDLHEALPWFQFFQFYNNLPFVYTEVLCLSMMNITIGLLLLAIKYNTWKTNSLFAVSLFYLYQVRPNVSYIALLVPFWAVAFATIERKKIFVRFFLLSMIPVILFGFVRQLVIGQFGLSTMTGGTLVGHAVQYLNETNIKTLSGESRLIGEDILATKRQLTPPCNATPFTKPPIQDESMQATEARCFGANLMVAWDVAIKHQSGKEPFEEPEKNIEPWKYTGTISPFYFANYHTSTDKLLMKFAKDILKIEWKQYLSWILNGGLYGIQIVMLNVRISLLYWTCILIAVAVQVVFRRRTIWQHHVLAFAFMVFTNFVAGYLLLLLFNFPFDRMFVTLVPYILPALVLLAIPPIWIKK
jgi:hypothetical protein